MWSVWWCPPSNLQGSHNEKLQLISSQRFAMVATYDPLRTKFQSSATSEHPKQCFFLRVGWIKRTERVTLAGIGLARWPDIPLHGESAQGFLLVPVSGVDEAEWCVREQVGEHQIARIVREVKEFRVSSLSSAAEQRRFAMTIM